MLEMFKRAKPKWIEPNNQILLPPLKVHNSLTNKKDLFKPREGKRVEWYSCGPTVYDVSHMGHARTYMSIDIIRRIMRDYLGYDLHYVMNITDVDDKIIKRARQNYLFDNYAMMNNAHIRGDVEEVLHYCEKRVRDEKDPEMKIMLEREKATVENYLKNGELTSLDEIKDAISAWLDTTRGDTVTDNRIFEDLPRRFEKLFVDDMQALNILPPDDLPRVSEYIPQIVTYVKTIVARGFAYESNGSVYFDTERFDNQDGHYYAKLVPTAYGNASLLQEGEGVLSSVANSGDKRSPNDFALWKASKRGEPSWPSPWGPGRPGWHIECSVMAGDKCGAYIDIHTGGVDLKFPHHDNELAQSEAHFGCEQCVNYFLHTGHLTIAGCKMSKSLKNFISIKDALARHSSRQLRLAFLLSSWKDTLDYSDDLMTAALAYERLLLDFFFSVRHSPHSSRSPHGDLVEEDNLARTLAVAKQSFHDAICDSFNTRDGLAVLKSLIEDANKNISSANITAVAEYVRQMMVMFGVADKDGGESLDLVQYTDEQLRESMVSVLAIAEDFYRLLLLEADASNTMAFDATYYQFCDNLKKRCHLGTDEFQSACAVEKVVTRSEVECVLEVLAEWRQSVRVVCRENKWHLFLRVCDGLRDTGLVNVGVRLQDMENERSAIGLYPREILVASMADSANIAAKVTATAVKAKLPASTDPLVMFTVGVHAGQYSQYDSEGVPTHGADGAELSKTKRGKLKKMQTEQDKKYRAWLMI